MSEYTYEVIRETRSKDSTWPNLKVMDRTGCPKEALKFRDALRDGAEEGEVYYVEISWGSVNNV